MVKVKIMKSVIKSNVFDTFDVESVVTDVLHGSSPNFCELSPRVSSDFNSEVMAILVPCLICLSSCIACRQPNCTTSLPAV